MAFVARGKVTLGGREQICTHERNLLCVSVLGREAGSRVFHLLNDQRQCWFAFFVLFCFLNLGLKVE